MRVHEACLLSAAAIDLVGTRDFINRSECCLLSFEFRVKLLLDFDAHETKGGTSEKARGHPAGAPLLTWRRLLRAVSA